MNAIAAILADSAMKEATPLGMMLVVTLVLVDPLHLVCAMHSKKGNVIAEVVAGSVMMDLDSTASQLPANASQRPCVLHSRRESVTAEAVVDSATETTVMTHLHTVHLDQTMVPLELLVSRFRRVSVIEETLAAIATMKMHLLHRSDPRSTCATLSRKVSVNAEMVADSLMR